MYLPKLRSSTSVASALWSLLYIQCDSKFYVAWVPTMEVFLKDMIWLYREVRIREGSKDTFLLVIILILISVSLSWSMRVRISYKLNLKLSPPEYDIYRGVSRNQKRAWKSRANPSHLCLRYMNCDFVLVRVKILTIVISIATISKCV